MNSIWSFVSMTIHPVPSNLDVEAASESEEMGLVDAVQARTSSLSSLHKLYRL